MGKKKKLRLVKIDWVDSRSPTNQWEHLAELDSVNICHCTSIGFVLRDNDEVKIIASNIADMDDVLGQQASAVKAIPSCCIKRIVDLEERQ